MQAIARANRINEGKNNGMIVDYCGILKNLKLVEGVRGGSAAPGEYRRIQNYVVNAGTGQVIYTPPTAVEVPAMMSELVKWLNGDLDIHPVPVSGIAQFHLVHIHPFLDGNGAPRNCHSTLYLYKAGYDFKRLFTISEYYDRDRLTFYKSIQSVRYNGMEGRVISSSFCMRIIISVIRKKQEMKQIEFFYLLDLKELSY